MPAKYTSEFVDTTYRDYIGGLTLRQITAKYSCCSYKLSREWVKQGWEMRTRTNSTRPQHDFFSTIDSEIKAYLLGFFASDGHIEKRDYGSYTIKWDIHTQDEELLHLINEHIGNNTYKVFKLKAREVSGIGITSLQIGEDLLALGYDNHKTHTCFSLPTIDPVWMPHFIRGYFDGDGSIMIDRCGNSYNRKFNISAGHPEILIEIAAFLPTVNKVYFRNTSKVFGSRMVEGYVLDVSNMADIKSIYHYLYDDANYYLKRKHAKFSKAKLTAKEIANDYFE